MADDSKHFGIHFNSGEKRRIFDPFVDVIGEDSASARGKDAIKLYTQIMEMLDELDREFETDMERRLWINHALIAYEQAAEAESPEPTT